MAVLPGTVVATTFDVVVGGHWRNDDERAFAQLLGVAQNNLRASVVILNRTFDFNHSAFELLNVAQVFQIVWEHDDGTVLLSRQNGSNVRTVPASASCSSVPLTHWVVPTCLLASAKERQSCLEVLRAEQTPLIVITTAERSRASKPE